jgi:hypothetical protein
MNLQQLSNPNKLSSGITLEGVCLEHLNNIRAEILTSKRFAKWRKQIKQELKKIQNNEIRN